MPGLRQCKLFDSLNDADFERLRASAAERHFAAGEVIFREGDPGCGVYIVGEGLVEICASVSAEERRVLSRACPGDFFGEMASVDDEPRSATATAAQPTTCYLLSRDNLMLMLDDFPRIAVTLMREFSRRMREFNRRYVQEALQAERLTVVGRFARSIVHDFKNPLNIIGLAADILASPGIPEEIRQSNIGRIRQQTDRLARMTSELIEFTRGAQRGPVLSRAHYGEFVRKLVDELASELRDKQVRLVLRGDPPDAVIPLDQTRLGHVFTNLIHNAVEAMPDGGEISLSFQSRGGEIITEIEDQGPGLAPEILPRLFEAFATHGKVRGSGLGLSICKRVIEDHRGWIKARSEPGRGAVFSFGLPMA